MPGHGRTTCQGILTATQIIRKQQTVSLSDHYTALDGENVNSTRHPPTSSRAFKSDRRIINKEMKVYQHFIHDANRKHVGYVHLSN